MFEFSSIRRSTHDDTCALWVGLGSREREEWIALVSGRVLGREMSLQYEREEAAYESEDVFGDSICVPNRFQPLAPVLLFDSWNPIGNLTNPQQIDYYSFCGSERSCTVVVGDCDDVSELFSKEACVREVDSQFFDKIVSRAGERARARELKLILFAMPGWSRSYSVGCFDADDIPAFKRSGFEFFQRTSEG